MKTKLNPFLFLAVLTLPFTASAQPFVTNLATSVYAFVPDPLALSFGADGALYVGRDASGSGGAAGAAVKVHRVAPGGPAFVEFGDTAITDPDALIVDRTGGVSGTPGAVLVGGVHNDGSTGKIVKIAPDGTVTTVFAPSATWWNPSDFAFDQSGRLLITEINNGRVLVTSSGSPAVLFNLSGAHHIAVDTLDRILVTANNSTQLRLYTSGGTLSNASFAAVKTSSPLARGPGGDWGTDIYAVAPNGDLIRIALDGSTKKAGSGFLMTSGAAISALAFGPDGTLYASDFEADRIYRFSPPTVPGAETTVYARVTDPERLSFAPDGTLFVGRDNTGSGGDYDDAVKIHRIGPGGSPVEEFGNTAITDPDAVFCDVTGQFSGTPGAVIVAGTQLDASNGKIVKILPDGTVTTIYGPTGFGFNPNLFVHDEAGGRLLFSDDIGGKVWTMTNTTPVQLFSLPAAFPLAVDSLGRIIAASDSSWLRLYSAEGSLLDDTYVQAQANTMIVRGPGGFWGTDVYFVGTNLNLMRLETNGTVSQVGTSFGGLSGFAFGPDGALYVSQHGNDLIWRIAPTDAVVRPKLTATLNGAQLQLAWAGVANQSYQLQSTTNLPPAAWLPEGMPFAGTGGLLTTNVPVGPGPRKFFRLSVSN